MRKSWESEKDIETGDEEEEEEEESTDEDVEDVRWFDRHE